MRDTGYWKGKERSCRSPSEDPGCTAREAEVSERDCTKSRSGSIWGAVEGGVGRWRWRWRCKERDRETELDRGRADACARASVWRGVASGPGFGHGRRALGWEEQEQRSKEASDAQAMVDGRSAIGIHPEQEESGQEQGK
ncbi:hypothetical protein B0H13DRAFT_1872508 [Mycena leptocephala]|nr:hypothetical protein B0H13DRAFT_1872508 [Mycena leptocephala]